MTHIDVARFSPNDFDDVVNFLEYAITDTFNKEGIGHLRDEIKNEVNSKIAYLNKDIETNGDDLFFLIAKQNHKIVGTIEYSPLSQLITENTNGEFTGLNKVGTIYVHPDIQRMGIGSKMLLSMMDELKNRGVNNYCLDTGYNTALAIWTKLFGSALYTLNNYWGDGQHHSIWHLSVDDTIQLLSNK